MTTYSEYDPDRRSPDPDSDSTRVALIAGIVAALILLALLGFFLLRNGSDTLAASSSTSSAPTSSSQVTDTTGNAGTVGVAAGYTPEYVPASCEFSLLAEVEHECGWLTVPEDRQNPANGRQVEIHVVRFASNAADAPADPIVYLDGGPGGSTLDALPFSFSQVWEPVLDDRDLILFDQRGVGFSTPSLDCPEERTFAFDTLDQDLPADDERSAEIEVIEKCHDRLVADGVDLSQYNSAENAADVADLRIALGIEEWNLLGISYGTRLAATVMRDHPEGVRSVILDSTYTPEANLLSQTPANLDRALTKLWAGCDLDAACAERYPNLEERFYTLIDEYEANPVQTDVRDFFNSGSWDVLFDGDWLLGTLFQGLYSEQVIPLLPRMIEELEEGDTSTLSLLTSNTLANSEFFSLGMHLSVQCNEEVSFTSQDDIDAGLDGFDHVATAFDGSSNLGDFMFEACDVWQAGSADPVENEAVQSDIPTLVLAGEYDPITPPIWGANAAANLTNSTFVEFTGVGHGASLAGDCPLSVTFSFLADPTARPDTSCVSSMPPVDFDIPGEPPADLVLVSFSEDILGTKVSGVVPEGWESVGFGAYSRGDSAVDQTAILQQVAPFISPDGLVSLLAGQFDMNAEPEATGTQESSLGTWQLYRGEADEFSIDIAAIDLGGSSAVILVITNPGEREHFLGQLLLPAIEAFRSE